VCNADCNAGCNADCNADCNAGCNADCNAGCNETRDVQIIPEETVSPPVARKPREIKVALKVRLKLAALCVQL